MGLKFGGDYYLNTAGIKLLLDSRRDTTEQGTNKLNTWSDIGSTGLVFKPSGSATTAQSSLIDGVVSIDGITSTSSLTCGELTGDKTALKFLHNGSPFGVYCLFKNDVVDPQTSSATNAVSIFKNYSLFSHLGYRIDLDHTNNRITAIIKRASSNGEIIHTPADSLNYGSWSSFSHVNREPAGSNNQKLYVDEALVTTSTNTTYGADADHTEVNKIMTITAGEETSITMGLFMAFDWTGFTPAEIDVFDASIRSLLTLDRAVFEAI